MNNDYYFDSYEEAVIEWEEQNVLMNDPNSDLIEDIYYHQQEEELLERELDNLLKHEEVDL